MDFPSNYIRNVHSAALMSHESSVPDKYNIHSVDVQVNRRPAYPGHTPDLSVALIEETKHRRNLHTNILDKDQHAFRRKCTETSVSKFLDEEKALSAMLCDLHSLRDDQDKGRIYTYSRLRNRIPEVGTQAPGLEDFIQPNDPSRPRTTGYNPGHARNILGLDTHGPFDSDNKKEMRDRGDIPGSPNVDRFSVVPPNSSTRVKALTGDFNFEVAARRKSSANSKSIGSDQGGASGNHFFTNANARPLTPDSVGDSQRSTNSMSSTGSGKSLVGPNKNVLSGTLGYYGKALSKDEIQSGDIKFRRSSYFRGYKDTLDDKRRMTNINLELKSFKKVMHREASEQKLVIDDFEMKLESAKMNSGS